MNALATNTPPVRTTCPYCGVGCGVSVRTDAAGAVLVSGDPEHPANLGRLCSKGSALADTIGLADRLLYPMVRQGDGTFAQIGMADALDRVAWGLRDTIEKHGPDSVAFYLSGQLLTEDYYVANKLMKGFLGSANVDTNSRLCMASSVAGHRRAFGSDTVPGNYTDLDQADLIILVGSNAAWCHPILYHRMIASRRDRGARLVVIDPRRTASAEQADLFLPVAPGMDTILFSGLLVHLADNGVLDRNYVAAHVSGFDEALAAARAMAPTIAKTAAGAGLADSDVARFFDLFLRTEKVVTCYSQGVNQSAQGTDKVTTIINCHLASGRIGRPGMGPFSLTGQPNAMGGREVGGLANQLAAHMNFVPDDIDRVGRFWRASQMAQRDGLKAVQMFDAIERGEIRALWVMATNPAVSLPRAGAVREALKKLDLFVVSENVLSNDTVNAGAQILLPAAAWGEKDGTVTNSERRISRQRSFLPLPSEVKPDWWLVAEVARRLGYGDAFAYRTVADIFREHAALSAFENDGRRDFDIGALADISDELFNAMTPVLWPFRAGTAEGRERLFADGGYFTASGKAHMHVPKQPELRRSLTAEFPLRLNTGRVRDQWHTMTRTGRSPRLAEHRGEPFVEINPRDAEAAGLVAGGFARVTSPFGACVLRVAIEDGQQPGSLFVPIHWSDETATSSRVGELVNPDTDPFSGQPEAKATPAAIAPVVFAYRGFVLTRDPVAFPSGAWWSKLAVENGSGYLFASNDPPERWQEAARAMFGANADLAEYEDGPRGFYRAAAFSGDRLSGCLFVAPHGATPLWDTVKALFGAGAVAEASRRVLLSGQSADGLQNHGPVICACFGVGLNTIRGVIETGAAASVEDIGKALKAGTNCGSCVPELKQILAQYAAAPVAG